MPPLYGTLASTKDDGPSFGREALDAAQKAHFFPRGSTRTPARPPRRSCAENADDRGARGPRRWRFRALWPAWSSALPRRRNPRLVARARPSVHRPGSARAARRRGATAQRSRASGRPSPRPRGTTSGPRAGRREAARRRGGPGAGRRAPRTYPRHRGARCASAGAGARTRTGPRRGPRPRALGEPSGPGPDGFRGGLGRPRAMADVDPRASTTSGSPTRTGAAPSPPSAPAASSRPRRPPCSGAAAARTRRARAGPRRRGPRRSRRFAPGLREMASRRLRRGQRELKSRAGVAAARLDRARELSK